MCQRHRGAAPLACPKGLEQKSIHINFASEGLRGIRRAGVEDVFCAEPQGLVGLKRFALNLNQNSLPLNQQGADFERDF